MATLALKALSDAVRRVLDVHGDVSPGARLEPDHDVLSVRRLASVARFFTLHHNELTQYFSSKGIIEMAILFATWLDLVRHGSVLGAWNALPGITLDHKVMAGQALGAVR